VPWLYTAFDGQAQYPHGAEGRAADIGAGSVRSWDDLVDDVRSTGAALATRWAEHDDWTGTATTLGGDRALASLPFLRQREVEIHRVDLGLGYEFASMPSEYVRRELRMMEMLWKARKPMGMTPLPTEALRAPPHVRLSWMTGRADIPGLPPADLW
jgi:maleylpyruvate isomerase